MRFQIKKYPELNSVVEKMTVRELIKTVVCPQHRAQNLEMEKGYVSLFLHETTKENAQKFLANYHEEGKPDTVIVSDLECGAGEFIEGCVRFPSMGALGKIGDPELAYKVGLATAKESLAAGYRWSLAPCVDIVFNHESPMVSIRAAGEDADIVIDIAGAYMRGMQDGGLAATLKHFPGDGVASYDQHITTSVNSLSKEDWMASYGKVYRTLIDQGAMSVMPGHIALPSYDEPDTKIGLCPPATLSYNLMTKLLKQEFGFEGIICSDAVTMSGFSGFMNYYEACATFLKNGGDVLLFGRTDDVFYNKMETLVASGFLPLDELKDRALRVLCFVEQLRTSKPQVEFAGDVQALADEVVRRSVHIERDRTSVLPIKAGKQKNILVADISNVYNGTTNSQDFYAYLRNNGYHIDFVKDVGSKKMAEFAESGCYDLIICTVDNGVHFATNVLRLHGSVAHNMMDGWTRLGTPVIFLCFQHPYFHEQFAALADTVVYTYGVANETFNAVERTLFA